MSANKELLEKEVNEQFKEFLNTKGLTAKFKLAFENMKESCKEQHEKDVKSFNEIKEKTKEQIAKAKELGNVNKQASVNDLNKEFNAFLKAKCLDSKYIVTVEEIKQ